MVREQLVNSLETAVVLLTLTNAVSIEAAAYAISLSQRHPHRLPCRDPAQVAHPSGTLSGEE
jgi:hypothetical protein